MNWKVNCKTCSRICVYIHTYMRTCLYTHIHIHIYGFRPPYFSHLALLNCCCGSEIPPSKQTNRKGFAKEVGVSAVARAQSGRRERLYSIRPVPFFGRMEAEHLPKAKVPSVHHLAHLGVSFLQHQHLFQVEFKCLRMN